MKIPSFLKFIREEFSKAQLNSLEFHIDRLFSLVKVDVNFSRHFLERLNDERNKTEITPSEIAKIFQEFYVKYKDEIAKTKSEVQAVLVDLTTSINIPFVVELTDKGIVLTNKTVMRKKSFQTSNQILKVNTK